MIKIIGILREGLKNTKSKNLRGLYRKAINAAEHAGTLSEKEKISGLKTVIDDCTDTEGVINFTRLMLVASFITDKAEERVQALVPFTKRREGFDRIKQRLNSNSDPKAKSKIIDSVAMFKTFLFSQAEAVGV